MRDPEVHLDHLVLAVPDLQRAVVRVRAEWGCEVHPGGRHPRWGSWNAVVPLEGGAYLEIIAPHPEPPEEGARVFGLDGLAQEALVTWAVRPGSGRGGALPAIVAAVRSVGVEMGTTLAGSRRTPEGRLLEWTLTDPYAPRLGGTVPFLIDWGATPHPSALSAPRVCLLELELGHPDTGRLDRALRVMGCRELCRLMPTHAPSLQAVLGTPSGEVILAGP